MKKGFKKFCKKLMEEYGDVLTYQDFTEEANEHDFDVDIADYEKVYLPLFNENDEY